MFNFRVRHLFDSVRSGVRAAVARWKALDPPASVLAAVGFAIVVLPGGIPLTAAIFPLYARRRALALGA